MTMPLPFVVIVSDGLSIRTIHPPALGRHRDAIEAELVALLGDDETSATPPLPLHSLEVAAREDAHPATLTQREMATVSGYSGDACATCGSFAMRRTGTCLTCESCGTPSGGCS